MSNSTRFNNKATRLCELDKIYEEHDLGDISNDVSYVLNATSPDELEWFDVRVVVELVPKESS